MTDILSINDFKAKGPASRPADVIPRDATVRVRLPNGIDVIGTISGVSFASTYHYNIDLGADGMQITHVPADRVERLRSFAEIRSLPPSDVEP